jgi:hypothetical protein
MGEPGPTAPSQLESRYRRLLRLLPERYRDAWAEDMVTALLDARGVDGSGSDQDLLAGVGRLGPGEVASVVSLAVRVRLGAHGASADQVLWGGAVRRFALLGLLVAAAGSLAPALWELTHGRWLTLFPVYADWLLAGPWRSVLGAAPLLWVPAFLALVAGHRRLGTALAVLALVPDTLRAVLEVQTFPSVAPTRLLVLVLHVLPVLALVAFHDRAPRPAARPWLTALAITSAALLVPAWTTDRWPDPVGARWLTSVLLDWAGVWALVAATTGLVHLRARASGHPFGRPVWTLALALACAAATLQRAVFVADLVRGSNGFSGYRSLLVSGLVELALVTGVAVVLATLARADLRAGRENDDGPAPVRGTGPSVTA